MKKKGVAYLGGAKKELIDENILEIIRKYLTVKDREKKLFGEVFTPVELICEMLDKLPKEVWANPDLKWLDPANGIGNFPVVAYYKLMEGLKEAIPEKSERSKHIIEQMLTMVELNPINCKVCTKIFKMIDTNATPNVIRADFFQWNTESRDKFDIIMGNPPYNRGGVGKGGGVFWVSFVNNSLDLLNMGGYLNFIHPLGWRKPFKDGDRLNNAGRIWYKFKELGNLVYVKISDKKIANFPKVDFYVFQKKKISNFKTRVINQFSSYSIDEIMNISKLDFVPNFVNKLSLSILNKLFSKIGEKFNIIHDQSFKAIKKNTKFIPNSTEHAYAPSSLTDYEIAYKKYTEIPEYIDLPKVILTFKAGTSRLHSKLISKFYLKSMGTTVSTMYQLVDNTNEGQKYEKYFNSDLLTFLIKITQYSVGQFASNEFKILNLISKPIDLKDNPTDEDIYRYYDLTPEEIDLIEEIVPDTPLVA